MKIELENVIGIPLCEHLNTVEELRKELKSRWPDCCLGHGVIHEAESRGIAGVVFKNLQIAQMTRLGAELPWYELAVAKFLITGTQNELLLAIEEPCWDDFHYICFFEMTPETPNESWAWN